MSISKSICPSLILIFVSASFLDAQPTPDWNRRVTGLTMSEAAGSTFDVTAEWRIDLVGSTSVPVELGTGVDLLVNTGTTGGNDSPDCVIWEVNDGVACSTAADGTICGTATISGLGANLTCDSSTGTCSTPTLSTTFTGVALTNGDIVEVLLRPAPGAQPDPAPGSDDEGGLRFGSWNRRITDLSAVPSPGMPPGFWDVTASIVVEVTHGASVPLNLGMETEPVADECCLEACCCPPCSTECGGGGCGGGGGSTQDINIGIGELQESMLACPSGTCPGTCGFITSNGNTSSMTCSADDCVCRSDPIILTWQAIPVDPGDPIVVVLRPVPGALPELPGFGDDESSFDTGPDVPALGQSGLLTMFLSIVVVGIFLGRKRRFENICS